MADREFCERMLPGVSRTFAGHGSDGLVRIENAVVCGTDGAGRRGQSAAKAFGPLPSGFKDDALPVVFSFDPRLIR